MDAVLFILFVIAVVALWGRTAALTERLSEAEQTIERLAAALHALREDIEARASMDRASVRQAAVEPDAAARAIGAMPRPASAASASTVAPPTHARTIERAGPHEAPSPAAAAPVGWAGAAAKTTGTARRPADVQPPWLQPRAAAPAERAGAAIRPPEEQAAPAAGWGTAAFSPAARQSASRSGLASQPAAAVEPLLPRLLDRLGITPPSTAGGSSRASVEAWLEGRMLAVVGGVALLLGAIFFLSLAFSRGWITEPLRVLIGLVAGAGLLLLGEIAFSRLRGILGHVLVPVGLAIISLALFAATRLYQLVPVELGLVGSLLAAAAAAAIAVRHDSELVAAYGLLAVLAAPPLLGANPTVITLLFLAVALLGTTGVALFRTWSWLPPLAFVVVAPQLAWFVLNGPPSAEEGVALIAGFWLVNLLAAGGEETRHAADRLRTATVTLLLANAAFTMWAGFVLLAGPLESWRGSFLAALAVAHLALGLFFLVRHGDRHPFGLVVAATGVAVLTMAVPVQFGGPPVPIAWSAEAVALAWVAMARHHPYSAAVSLVLAVLAAGHLVGVEYPPSQLWHGFERSIPFVGPEGMTAVFMLASLAVAAFVVRIAWIRAGIAVVGGLVAVYVLPFELSGPSLVSAWAAIATVGLGLHARVVAPRIPAGSRLADVQALRLPAPAVAPVSQAVGHLAGIVRPAFAAVSLLAGGLAVAHVVVFDYPPTMILAGLGHAIPFVGWPGVAFGALLAAFIVTGILVRSAWARVGLVALGGIVGWYVLPFELSGPALVAAWAALGTAAFAVEDRLIARHAGAFLDAPPIARWMRRGVPAVGVLAFVAMAGHLITGDFPMVRFEGATLSALPYVGPEGASLAAALAALVVSALVVEARWFRLGMSGLGVALLVYSVPFEIRSPQAVIAWSLLALAAVAIVRRAALVPLLPLPRRIRLESAVERLPYAAACLAVLLMLARAFSDADPGTLLPHLTGTATLTGIPFVDERSFVVLVLAATLAATGVLWRGIVPGARAAAAAALAVAWLLPFEIRTGYAIAGWSAIAVAGLWLASRVPATRPVGEVTALVLLALGGLLALAVAAPPDRLVVDAGTSVIGWPLLTDATVALTGLAIALAAGGVLHRAHPLGVPALAAAGATIVYLLSIAVVDQFQIQVGSRPVDELEKGAQVGLSVLWSVLGTTGFAAGLVARRPQVRVFGLALLGLATAKVFVVDLAALDVTYRVLSFVALGVLLLASAAAFSRLQHPRGPVAPTHP